MPLEEMLRLIVEDTEEMRAMRQNNPFAGVLEPRERLVLVSGANTRFVRGWCLEVHDLAIGKYVAGRPKDLTFTEALIRHRMLDRNTLESRLASTVVAPEIRELTNPRIARQFEIG
jgi:hypothetical protein